MNAADIKVGDWILREQLTRGRFGLPNKVTRVAGTRIYFEVENWSSKTKSQERFCADKSVVRVVASEEAGRAAFEEQRRLNDICMKEESAAQEKFRIGMYKFFAQQEKP